MTDTPGMGPARGESSDLGGYLQKGLQILQLEPEAIRSASADEDALLPAFLFCASAGVAAGAGQLSLRGMVVGAVLYALLSFVLTGLLNVLARLFGGTSTVLELYRPLGLATPIYWVQAVPLLGSFLGILAVFYFIVVAGATLETAGGLDRPRAVAVMGILTGVSVFLVLVFFAMLGSLMIFRALFS